jgi:hypothetical protein
MPHLADRMRISIAFALVLTPALANAQVVEGERVTPSQETASGPETTAYVPVTNLERVDWIVDGTIGPQSLAVGVIGSGWQTGFNTPSEWGGGKGFTRRYLEREADVAISNSLEAGLGALWGEDPRYIASRRQGLWPRARYAMKTVVLATRRDGRRGPAWGRFAGNVFNNVIENSWLPPSVTTPGQTALRSAQGLAGRLLGNLWEEFWPDLRKRLRR